MDIFRLSIAKLRARPVNAAVNIALFAIGIGIISLVMLAGKTAEKQFLKNLAGIDLVAGAKGSPLQLILSSVFHADTPTGNISFGEAEQISRNPMVEKTIPIALGDNYQGFRIAGTSPEYGLLYGAEMKIGDWFKKSFEAVAGAEAARKTGLALGDTFTGRHGFGNHGHHHDEEIYTVTGILKPTGTVLDKLILTTVDTYWMIHSHGMPGSESDHSNTVDSHRQEDDALSHQDEHGHDHGQHVHTEECSHAHHNDCGHMHDEEELAWKELIARMDAREELSAEEMELYRARSGMIPEAKTDPSGQITALLIFYRTPRAAVQLPRLINDNTRMQAASPAFETYRLFGLLGTGISALRWLAWTIIVISGINILILLTNTLHQNLHEVALLRSLGASRFKVMALLMLQGLMLSLAGWLTGLTAAKIAFLLIPATGILASGTESLVSWHDLLLLAYSTAAGFLAALIPAIKAYRSDIHDILNKT